MKKKIKQNHLFFFYCFLIAFFYLLFTSKNSFLYTFNDWADANSFFTVGKSIFRGIVPYRDLFEQKGLLLYFIYGIGSILSSTTFHGVFILEVFFFTFFLYYIYKTISLFLNEKYTYILLPLITYFIVSSLSFFNSGSAEEFCLPMFSYTLYSFLKYFKLNSLTQKELLINGIMAGMVLMIKYNMLGFWISIMFFLFLHILLKKGIKELIISISFFLLGMFLPFGVCSIYLFINGAFMDFIECYFITNIKYYPNNVDLYSRLHYLWVILSAAIYNSKFLVKYLFIWLVFLLVPIKIKRYAKISIVFTFVIMYIFIYWGLREYSYYFLPMHIFLIFSLIGICYLIENIKEKLKIPSFHLKYLPAFCFLVGLGMCYLVVNPKEFLKDKSDIFQYQFAEYLSQYDNPTLLNIGSLDMGVYTTSNIVPSTRFFHLMNFDYDLFPDNYDALKKSVENKETQFLVYTTNSDIENDDYDFSNYEVVMKAKHQYEITNKISYLLKLREDF